MRRSSVLALTLGLALSVVAGAGSGVGLAGGTAPAQNLRGVGVWALTLGLALSVVAGSLSVVASTAAPAPEQTRDLEANAGATMSTEPWPGADAIMSEAGRGVPAHPSMGKIGL